jgi:hypothetical protein
MNDLKINKNFIKKIVYIDKFENSDYFFPTLKIIEKYENVNA